MNWSEQVVLVTGGTGSFGKKFVEIMLKEYQPKRLVIFSRDELKQHDMRASGLDHPACVISSAMCGMRRDWSGRSPGSRSWFTRRR